MAFYNPVSPQTQILEAPTEVLNRTQDLALAVGRIIHARPGQNPENGEPGIFVGKNFIPAKLPPGLNTGDKLLLKVEQIADSVLLKVIQNLGLNIEADFFQSLSKIVQSTSSQESFFNLKDIIKTTNSDPLALLNTQKSEPAGGPESQVTTQVLTQIFNQILDKLPNNVLATETTLQDPQKLEQLIRNFLTQNGPLSNLKLAEPSSTSLQRTPASNEIGVLQIIKENITALLESPEPLDFETTRVSSPSAPQLKLLLALTQYAKNITSPDSLQSIDKVLSKITIGENPLGILLSSIANFTSTAESSSFSSEHSVLVSLLENVTSQLTELKHSKAKDPQIREALRQALTTLDAETTSIKKGESERNIDQAVNNLTSNLDKLFSAQAALKSANSVANLFNEPIFILIPTILDNINSNWEFSFNPDQKAEADTGESGQNGKNGFNSVNVDLRFPTLGKVRIELAHDDSEVLINFHLENNLPQELIDKYLPSLDTIIREQGFSKQKVNFLQLKAKTDNLKPMWLSELVKDSLIA